MTDISRPTINDRAGQILRRYSCYRYVRSSIDFPAHMARVNLPGQMCSEYCASWQPQLCSELQIFIFNLCSVGTRTEWLPGSNDNHQALRGTDNDMDLGTDKPRRIS